MKIYRFPIGPIRANCYVLIDEKTKKAAVVDPGDYTRELKNLLHSEEIESVEYIFLTHGHFDHILGMPKVKEDFSNAKVCIHKEDSKFLLDGNLSLARMSGISQTPVNCDIALEDGSKIKLGSLEFEVMHTPGHTPGGVCYICESEKAIFSGDTLFRNSIGRTDFPGGDYLKLLNSLRNIKNLNGDYVIYTGHEGSTTLNEEREHNMYMRKL